MVLAVLVFVFVAAGILGGYAAVAYLPGAIARRRLDRRLHDVTVGGVGDGVSADTTVVKREAEGPLPAVDRLMSHVRGGSWLTRLIQQSGVRTTASAVLVMSLGCAAACGLLAMVFVRQPVAAPAAALAGAGAPLGWLRHRRTSRLKRFEEQFPEALDLLSRAIRAGHAFQAALEMAASELREPVGPELRTTFDQQNFGLPLRDALDELSDRVPILDVRFFVTAVLIQRDTGGNLAEILDNLAHVVRERFKIRRQVRVHTAHGRFTAFVLLVLPPGLAIVLSFINPDHMQLLFRERLGQMMLVGTIVLQTIGFFWIRKVIRIEV